MQCVNPECCREAQDLYTGTLRLLELAIPPEKRIVRADSGFPVVAVPSRYFWLCSQCSRIWKIKRWTPAGLILEPNPGSALPGAGLEQNHSLTIKIAPARETPQSRIPTLSDLVA